MKFVHVSDTHSLFPTLEEADFIVHSGDLLPNATRGFRFREEPFQRQWVIDNRGKFQRWIGSRPFIYCAGNHDYFNPIPILRDAGIDAYNISDVYLELMGIRFYGFPWVRYFTGEWNYEISETEIEARLDFVKNSPLDIFVSHGPMRGVLDRNRDGERCGSIALRTFLQTCKHAPKYFLFGHIHAAAGSMGWSRGIICSNASLTQRVFTYPS